jgi:hypothetical protein
VDLAVGLVSLRLALGDDWLVIQEDVQFCQSILHARGVCLEHGKEEPRPSVKYEIKPVEAFSKDPALYEMLKLFGDKKINQRVAQVAAWHIASKMSWEQLAAKQLKRIGQEPQPYFSQQELRAAMQLVEAAKTIAAEKEKQSPKSPGQTTLSSR